MKPPKIHFMSNIRTLRVKHGLNKRELAKELKTNIRQVFRWEDGTSLPTIPHAIGMSRLFGITLDQLVFEKM
jgi:ribosome-binding protein aMBF1 (putative translation factor)